MALRNKDTGVTLIELIIAIVVLSVLAIGMTAFFIPMINLFFYTPVQMTTYSVGQDLMDIIIEGDNKAKGLRSAVDINSATASQIDYDDQDGKNVVLSWDNTDKQMSRNIDAAGAVLIPARYYADVKIQGKDTSTVIFTYYDSSDSEISAPVADTSTIESIQLDWTLLTGSGDIDDFEGKINISSAVDIKTFD